MDAHRGGGAAAAATLPPSTASTHHLHHHHNEKQQQQQQQTSLDLTTITPSRSPSAHARARSTAQRLLHNALAEKDSMKRMAMLLQVKRGY